MCFYVFHSWQGAIQECSGGTKGGAWGSTPPIRGSAHHFPPVRRKKWQKSAIFSYFFIFAPSDMHFVLSMPPPQKKKFWGCHCKNGQQINWTFTFIQCIEKVPYFVTWEWGGQMIKILFGQRLSCVNIWTVLVLAIEHLVIPVWKIGSFWNYIQL